MAVTRGYTIKQVDRMHALHHGAVKLAGAELGVESFGIQVLDLPAGFDGYPEHDHTDDGQEEVYVVLRGTAEFHIDGERIPVEGGEMVRVDPECTRTLKPGAHGVRVLAIGCAPGSSYERPQHFRLAVGA
jgi:mannose-6-phosphate isomerase-like protein (cupin superfamily)